MLYKNVVGTYLHGPLLPKNPHISDYLIKNALKRKYGTDELTPLDDTQELEANASIYQRFGKNKKRCGKPLNETLKVSRIFYFILFLFTLFFLNFPK